MHKKSPTGGEDTLYIPFKFYKKVPCVSNKRPSCHGIMKEIFESFSDRRFPMPYINIKITREGVTAEQKAELIKGATELLARVLNKNPKTTIVTIEEVDMDSWGIGGDPVEIAREKGEAQDAKIARLDADKEEQERIGKPEKASPSGRQKRRHPSAAGRRNNRRNTGFHAEQ